MLYQVEIRIKQSREIAQDGFDRALADGAGPVDPAQGLCAGQAADVMGVALVHEDGASRSIHAHHARREGVRSGEGRGRRQGRRC